jgi:hypothetical protein
MNPGAKVTACFIVVFIAIAIVYDIFAGLTWGVEATISRTVWYASKAHPVFPFATGVLCGHLFASQSLNDRIRRLVWK